MWTRFAVAAHLSADELARRYRAARDPVERSRWQMIWLLVSGRPLGEVAAVTGYSTRWVREVVRRYNTEGATALKDRRHANAGAAPLLDAKGQAALEAALHEPPPDGGRWSGRQVAAWIARWLHRPPGSIAPARPRYKWLYLYAFVHPTSGAVEWFTGSTVDTALFSAVLARFATAVGAGPHKRILLVPARRRRLARQRGSCCARGHSSR